MSNDYRNSEGYPDPTAGEALSRIAANEKQSLRAFRPIVYICSPFSGDVETNVANARRYSRYAVDKGYIPIASHRICYFRSSLMMTIRKNVSLVFSSEMPS